MRFLACCILAFSLILIPAPAFADVRKSDVVLGLTIEERGAAANFFPSIQAEYALLLDGEGNVYFDRNSLGESQIASITKIMTATIVLDQVSDSELNKDKLTVSARAASVGESSAELKEGDTLSLYDCLQALLIPSGNDAAITLAEFMGSRMDPSSFDISGQARDFFSSRGVDLDELAQSDDPIDVFVCAMNLKALEIGCTETVFTNPHGLDDGQYGTTMHSNAKDVATMSLNAMRNETFRTIVDQAKATIEVIHGDGQKGSIELESTDKLIGVYEGACGIKTGRTLLAGSCFAGAVQRDGEYLYAIVLNSPNDEQRFYDAETLYNWYYENDIDYHLANSDETVSIMLNNEQVDAPIVAEVTHGGWIDKTVKATLADPDQTIEVFAVEGNISQEFHLNDANGNVKVGDVLGTVTFYQHNEELITVDVVAAEDVAAPNFIEGIGIWWERLMRSFSGEPGAASTVIINETPLIFDRRV